MPKEPSTTTRKPLIVGDDDQVDMLASHDTTRLRSHQVRPGMLLVDAELGTPIYALDHRIRASRWLAENLENGRYEDIDLGPSTPVAAR